MKSTTFSAKVLARKNSEQLLEIADSFQLIVPEEATDEEIINLILDVQEAPEAEDEPKYVPAYKEISWDEEDEEVVYARKPVLRPLTCQEQQAVKMKRKEMMESGQLSEREVYKKLILINEVMTYRQKQIEALSGKMEEESYRF